MTYVIKFLPSCWGPGEHPLEPLGAGTVDRCWEQVAALWQLDFTTGGLGKSRSHREDNLAMLIIFLTSVVLVVQRPLSHACHLSGSTHSRVIAATEVHTGIHFSVIQVPSCLRAPSGVLLTSLLLPPGTQGLPAHTEWWWDSPVDLSRGETWGRPHISILPCIFHPPSHLHTELNGWWR